MNRAVEKICCKAGLCVCVCVFLCVHQYERVSVRVCASYFQSEHYVNAGSVYA